TSIEVIPSEVKVERRAERKRGISWKVRARRLRKPMLLASEAVRYFTGFLDCAPRPLRPPRRSARNDPRKGISTDCYASRISPLARLGSGQRGDQGVIECGAWRWARPRPPTRPRPRSDRKIRERGRGIRGFLTLVTHAI